MAPSWELFYNVSAKIQATSSYQNDLVDVGRQVIVGLFIQYYQLWVQAYNKFDTDGMRKYSDLLLQLLVDEDMLMGTQQLYMLGYWIEQAQSFAQSPLELLQYKYNAINQVPLIASINFLLLSVPFPRLLPYCSCCHQRGQDNDFMFSLERLATARQIS